MVSLLDHYPPAIAGRCHRCAMMALRPTPWRCPVGFRPLHRFGLGRPRRSCFERGRAAGTRTAVCSQPSSRSGMTTGRSWVGCGAQGLCPAHQACLGFVRRSI